MAAIVGLIGVVVGALATFGATYFFELRRESRDARAARRLARSELLEATKAADDAIAGEEWPAGWHTKTWSQSWSTYRPVLATTMSDERFDTLARAYLQMELLQTGLAAGRRPLSGEDKAFLADARERLSEAVETLGPPRS